MPYAVDTQNPGVEVLLAPSVSYFVGNGPDIIGFDVAASGRFAAVTQSGGYGSPYAATAYLSSLDQLGSYVQIGSTFPAGTKLGEPVFSPDGQRVLMTAYTSSGLALYETTTAHPENLVRVSPFYPIDREIRVFKYTRDSTGIVYTANSRNQTIYDIFLIQVSQPGIATALNAPGSQSVSLHPSGSLLTERPLHSRSRRCPAARWHYSSSTDRHRVFRTRSAVTSHR